jgi:alpha-galactosidase
VGRPTVFSESAPAYFQGTPNWYDVLTWVRGYGQLWREGSDIATFDPVKPDAGRFDSVLWNYAYNLPLGRFQKPGNWNDADFIIGGDSGITLPETRSQLTLWSMMSAPLILSSDLDKLTPQAIAILSNRAVISVDQDPLGRDATLIRRSPQIDVLLKPLKSGEYAIAVLNRDSQAARLELHPADLGFAGNAGCRLDARDLWTGDRQSSTSTLRADVAAHDTAIWRVHAGSSCGVPRHTGVIVLTANEATHDHGFDHYTRCLSNSGSVEACEGIPAETWTFTAGHALRSAGNCLAVAAGKPVMQSCSSSKAQQWNYTLSGNLVSADQQCLTSSGSETARQNLELEACGHNRPDQIWSLPN